MAEIWRVWWKVVPVVVLVLAATCGSACELTASALPAEVDEDAVRRVGHFLWREVDMEGGEREMGDRDGYICQRPSRRVIYSSIPCIHTANNMNPLHTQSRALSTCTLALPPRALSPLSPLLLYPRSSYLLPVVLGQLEHRSGRGQEAHGQERAHHFTEVGTRVRFYLLENLICQPDELIDCEQCESDG